MELKFPKAFQVADTICKEIARGMKIHLEEAEIGYLAMHIERVTNDKEETIHKKE